MYFFIAGRQSGKTTKIIDWMRAAPEGVGRVCVCISLMECNRLQREYCYWDGEGEDPPGRLETWQFITWEEVVSHRDSLSGITRGRGWTIEYGIDNVEIILGQMSRWPIRFVTATGVDIPRPQILWEKPALPGGDR